MWACCSVEREVTTFQQERNRGLPTSKERARVNDRRDSGGSVTKASSRRGSNQSAGSRRGSSQSVQDSERNIGLGFVEQQRRASKEDPSLEAPPEDDILGRSAPPMTQKKSSPRKASPKSPRAQSSKSPRGESGKSPRGESSKSPRGERKRTEESVGAKEEGEVLPKTLDAPAKAEDPTTTPAVSESPSAFSMKKNKSFAFGLQSRASRILLDGEEDPDEDADEQKPDESAMRSPLQRRGTMNQMRSHTKHLEDLEEIDEEEDQRNSPSKNSTNSKDSAGAAKSVMKAVKAKLPKAFGGGSKGSSAPPPTPPETPSPSTGEKKILLPQAVSVKSDARGRRNSQFHFAETNQTAIIFDWDDTLFPTSYLMDDLRLNHKKLMKEQKLSKRLHSEVTAGLKSLEKNVIDLVNSASSLGKVILVTLARPPWVEQSCRCFYPAVGELIRQLRIKTVYAQEGVAIDYNRRKMMSDDEMERTYADMKGKAIGKEVKAFYSQYEGQSWKNIISIGDSDFERLGTIRMSNQYLKDQGAMKENGLMQRVGAGEAACRNLGVVEVNGHAFKLRTKTFKMLEYPTIGELIEELRLLQSWLPKMVALDDGFDADLNNLEDPHLMETIEEVLSGGMKNKSSTSPTE